MKKIIIISTVPMSLATLVKGQAKYLSQYFEVKLITSSSSLNEQIEKNENVEVKSIDMTRKITPGKDIKALFHVFAFLLREKPDVVYSFTPKAGLIGMMASYFARVPIRIHNIVGMPLMEATGRKFVLLKLTEKLTYFFATNLFSNSFGLKDYIRQHLTKKEVTVIAQGSINGVDTDYFKNRFSEKERNGIRNRYGISKEDFVLTFVGRIVKDKGINELIEAFVSLREHYPFIKLLLVGGYEEDLNPIKPENKALIDKSDAIITVGFQKDIRKFLAISNLFVLPSYREGLPNSLIEAGSFGVPLLATDINGCNEIIEENQTGILVKKKDMISLRNGIRKLLEQKELYEEIKSNVRKEMIKRYDQRYFWKELKNEFEKHFR